MQEIRRATIADAQIVSGLVFALLTEITRPGFDQERYAQVARNLKWGHPNCPNGSERLLFTGVKVFGKEAPACLLNLIRKRVRRYA